MKRTFTDDQEAQIAAEYVAGSTMAALAERYGVVPSTICSAIDRRGVPHRNERPRFRPAKRPKPDEESNESVGGRVRAARRKLGWNQAELSRRTGIAHSTVSRIERGEQALSRESLVAVAKALGISTDWLLGISTQPPCPYEVGMLLDVVALDGRVLHQTRVWSVGKGSILTEDTVHGNPRRHKRYNFSGIPFGSLGARIRPAKEQR